MSSLAAPVRPTSSASNRSSNHSNPPGSATTTRPPHSLSSSTPAGAGATYQHPHSHHSVGAVPSSTNTSSGFASPSGGLSPHLGSAGRPRQSLDAARMMLGASAGYGAGEPLSPRMGGLGGAGAGGMMRPQTEMLGLGAAGLGAFGATPETEAIDKWFEDLQSYEATLEEMAAASLDPNFKEELSAIEQWFRVLSEAERTAALYSLLQSSTQVQIRFFITVLQQMARSDPMTALLSPNTSGATSMEQQMEAKLAQLSSKSPASPVVRQFARQSLGADTFLSPHTGNVLSDSTSSHLNSGGSDAAALLERQRAKLKANRVSAPGSLLGSSAGSEAGSRSPKWGSPAPDDSTDGRYSRSPSPHRASTGTTKPSVPVEARPKSNGSDHAALAQQQQQQQAIARALAQSNALLGMGALENQLSPILGGSWASQVNTPLVPMFSTANNNTTTTKDTAAAPGLDEAASKLARWGAAHQASGAVGVSAPTTGEGASGAGGIQLDDARKFRRQTKIGTGFSGVLSGMGGSANSSPNPNNPAPTSLAPTSTTTTRPTVNTSNSFPPPGNRPSSGASPLSPSSQQPQTQAQQAAALSAQQNWRAAQQQSATGTGANSVPLGMGGQGVNGSGGQGDPNGLANQLAMMGMMNGMNGLSGINMNDPAALQNMTSLLQAQQQMQQVQQLQALQQQMQQYQQQQAAAQQMGILGVSAPGMLSPVSARLGMGFPGGFPNPAAAAALMQNAQAIANAQKSRPGPAGGLSPHVGLRSPANKPTHVPGSGSNPDEELDMKLLSDISAWLRGLRLHKYTPNFEHCTWQEMVMMGESDLEARGVAAVGARRKMLRTFETVRLKKGMALPGDGEGNTSTESAEKDGESTSVSPI